MNEERPVNIEPLLLGGVPSSPPQDMTTTNIIRIPIVTGITAGRGVPDDLNDWQIIGFRDVRMVSTTNPSDRYIAVPVEGDSLKEQGILDGDFLICRISRDYEPGKLGVWQTPHGRTAKLAFFDPDDYVVLHNDAGWRQTWSADEIRLLGIVIRVERDFE